MKVFKMTVLTDVMLSLKLSTPETELFCKHDEWLLHFMNRNY